MVNVTSSFLLPLMSTSLTQHMVSTESYEHMFVLMVGKHCPEYDDTSLIVPSFEIGCLVV
jgi:hypothetical protein